MNHCYWPNEQKATEDFVKFATVSFAHGVRKIFFHAGVCGAINGPDAGSVFFEYGGAPRKIFAGAAAWTRIVGVPKQCLEIINSNGLYAGVFETAEATFVAVAWCSSTREFDLRLPQAASAFDLMGKAIADKKIVIGPSPVYLEAKSAEALTQAFSSSKGK
jgi:hypothetical protein